MKCIILCGGYAKRLWPLTHETPKALLDVGGRAVLDHIFDKLENVGDISEFIISTNAKFENEFMKWTQKRKPKRATHVIAEPTNHEGEKLGAIGGLNYALGKAGITSEDFLVINGDNYFDFDLQKKVDLFKRVKGPVVAVYDVGDRNVAKHMGVVKTHGDVLVQLFEKPAHTDITLVSTGCYAFPARVIPMIKGYLAQGGRRDAPGHFISWLLEKTPTHVFRAGGKWFDIGNKDQLEAAREWAKNRGS